MSKEIYITDFDLKRLRRLIATDASRDNAKYIRELSQELQRAHVVDAKAIPGDVVTMNSKVEFTFLDSGDTVTRQVVFPEDADIEGGRISVLAPIGTALLGYRAGDVIRWEVPSGTTEVKITRVLYQPEAAGDYHL